MNLGNAIMMLRKEQKISRVKLAERSNLSITALYNIENNLSFPSKETIDRLCASLEIPVSYLMFYSITEEDVPEWGAREERGIEMEVSTAASVIAGGANAVILRHPKTVETIAKLVSELM